MRSFLIAAAVATAALALGGCQQKRQEPVPPPQSAPARNTLAVGHAPDNISQGRGASEISWFQGTLEEAFSQRPCTRRRLLSF
jgi:hypothetical protein